MGQAVAPSSLPAQTVRAVRPHQRPTMLAVVVLAAVFETL